MRYLSEYDRGWVLSLIAAVFLVYLPFLGNPFFFDDLYLINGSVLHRYESVSALLDFDLRWLSYASLAWTARLFSDVVPFFFHLGNTLLHAVNTVLLFYLLRQLIASVVPDAARTPNLVWGAWLAALVFALHPVAVFAVGYVAQRSILMATLFALLMQMAYLHGILSGRGRWLLLSVFLYFLAVSSKEHSVLAPAILIACTMLLREKNTVDRRMLWLTWGGFTLVAAAIILRASGVVGESYEPMAAALIAQQGVNVHGPLLHLLGVITQAGLYFKYLLLWLLPNVAWMSVDMREPFVVTIGDWSGWVGLLAFFAYGVAAVWLLLRGGIIGLAGFALLYPWLQFGVELTSIRVQEPFVLYRSYLWIPGLLLLIPLLLLRFPQRRMLWLAGGVVLLLVPLAWSRLWIFADEYRLWDDAASLLQNEKIAGADRIFFNRGQALMKQRRWEEAVGDFERSAAISPQLAPIHQQLGEAYSHAGRYMEAVAQFDVAIGIKADDSYSYFAKGVALNRLGRKSEAREQFGLSCKLGNYAACIVASGGEKR